MVARAKLMVVNDSTAGTPIITPNEISLLLNTDLSIWAEGNRATRDANSYISQITSHKQTSGGVEITATSIDAAHAPVYYTTTDSQKGIRHGYDNAGTTNNNHVPLRGDSNFLLPTGNWYVGMVSKMETPASGVSILWGTSDATTQFGFGVTNTDVVRFYYDYSTSVLSSGAGANNGTTPYLWETTWDGTNLIVYKNGTSVLSGTPTLPTLTDRKLRFFSINNAGTEPTALMFGYTESIFVGTLSTGLRTAVKAVVRDRHPSWTIA